MILNPMTMSVLKGQFSFPLTSYTKERKASISGAHGENRENKTERTEQGEPNVMHVFYGHSM